jgi:hypothetical protein
MAIGTRSVPTHRLRVLRWEPLCAETRLADQVGLLTRNDQFFVRSNFPHPDRWGGLPGARGGEGRPDTPAGAAPPPPPPEGGRWVGPR